jgi:hypothetical protein
MESNKKSKNGFRKNNYHRARQRIGSVFPWKGLGYGRFALCLTVLITEEKVRPGETYGRDFRACGLTDKWIYARLIEFLPWLPAKYLVTRGKPMTPSIVYNRWHKGVVYQTKSGAGNSYSVGCSSEHPRNHRSLQPLLAGVDGLFKRNKPITEGEVAAACYEVGMKFGRCGNED